MFFDVSCPNCGTFHAHGNRRMQTCPDCGAKDAIILTHDNSIDDRFRAERAKTDEESADAAD